VNQSSLPISEAQSSSKQDMQVGQLSSAVFGGGCFWCTEAVFKALRGVHAVQSGYCGGTVDHPTYEQVCSKQTGHIEVVKIDFDPATIRYAELLEVFLRRMTLRPPEGRVMMWGRSISRQFFSNSRAAGDRSSICG